MNDRQKLARAFALFRIGSERLPKCKFMDEIEDDGWVDANIEDDECADANIEMPPGYAKALRLLDECSDPVLEAAFVTACDDHLTSESGIGRIEAVAMDDRDVDRGIAFMDDLMNGRVPIQ
jgi:hypothetical protein